MLDIKGLKQTMAPYWRSFRNINLESSSTGTISGFTQLQTNTLSPEDTQLRKE